MTNKINIIDILQAIGQDRLKVQPLLPHLAHACTNDAGTELTISTKEITVNDILCDPDKEAYIVWVSKKDMNNAREKLCNHN